jgi:hypothetical protein
MALQKKIFLINLLLAIGAVTGFAFATDTFPGNGFFLMVSFITFFGGVGCALIALLLLLLKKDKGAVRGYLTSSLFFFILSAVSYFLLQQY